MQIFAVLFGSRITMECQGFMTVKRYDKHIRRQIPAGTPIPGRSRNEKAPLLLRGRGDGIGGGSQYRWASEACGFQEASDIADVRYGLLLLRRQEIKAEQLAVFLG
jgi:hypothetical protein